MASVYIQGVDGGETTNPTGEEGIELDNGVISTWAKSGILSMNSVPGGRLTLTSGTPVTTTDVTGATSVYYCPYLHNYILLWNGSSWQWVTFTEKTLTIGTVTSGLPYDVFGYLSSGALVLEKLAWTNGTTRATEISLQDGRYCKTGDKSRLYLGSFYTTSTTATADAVATRFLFNMYNRVTRQANKSNSTAHNYNTATVRAFNNDQPNSSAEFFIGLVENDIFAGATGQFIRAAADGSPRMAFGVNSTTTETFVFLAVTAITGRLKAGASIYVTPSLGYNYVCILEFTTAGTAPGTYFESGYINLGYFG